MRSCAGASDKGIRPQTSEGGREEARLRSGMSPGRAGCPLAEGGGRPPGPHRALPGVQVSKAAADLMTYCDAHACEDPLITPVPTSENPFREKKFFCALL